jgi:hypothetical protein
MNTRWVALVLLAACNRTQVDQSVADPSPTVSIAPLPTPVVASATPTARATPQTPADRVQAILPRWIGLLQEHNEAAFIDEAVVPEELEKVLDGKSKADLVAEFRGEKSEQVAVLLRGIRGVPPTSVREEGSEVLVTYEQPNTKNVTFVVRGDKVFIKN